MPSGTGLPPGVASAVRLYEAAVLGERREAELSLRVEQQVEKLRLKESREPPPPRAVRGAARHTKVGLFFAKLPLAATRKGVSATSGLCQPNSRLQVPSGPGPRLPRRRKLQWLWGTAWRRRQWVLLVVIESYGEWQCPQPGFLLLFRPAGQ